MVKIIDGSSFKTRTQMITVIIPTGIHDHHKILNCFLCLFAICQKLEYSIVNLTPCQGARAVCASRGVSTANRALLWCLVRFHSVGISLIITFLPTAFSIISLVPFLNKLLHFSLKPFAPDNLPTVIFNS